MGRQMRCGDNMVTVYSHGIAVNGWEYYFLDRKQDEHANIFALVQGDFTEFGDVHVPEVLPYMLSLTRDVSDIAPAVGWEWVD